MFEKWHAAKRHKRLGNAASHRSNSAPISRRQNQTLSNDTHGVAIVSAYTIELPGEFGIFGE